MKKHVGRLAVCGSGRIGRIHKTTSRGYFGIGIDAKPWFSRTPRLINSFDARQIEKTLLVEDVTALPVPTIEVVWEGDDVVPTTM